MTKVVLALSVFIVTALLQHVSVQPLQATDQRCFPETGYCIEGRFRSYWEQNGGLAVFGFPITAPQVEVNRENNQSYLTQWFERNRFELHPENPAPYDVLLGRLGDDRLHQLQGDWQNQPKAAGSQPDCLWFAQTTHNVCDQESGIGFKTYWQTHGLRDAQLDAYGQSLALFGYPLTEATVQRNPTDGQLYLTQWFERARFEWHPDKPDEYKVLLGLLGNELRIETNQTPVLLSSSILGDAVAVGRTLYWIDSRSAAQPIYAHNLDTGVISHVVSSGGSKRQLTTDGDTLAWIERPTGASERIRSYQLTSGTLSTLLIPDTNAELGGIALTDDLLFYQDSALAHRGIFAYRLSTQTESLIIADGLRPVVNGNALLWSTFTTQGSGAAYRATWSLYVRRLDGRVADTLLARADGQGGLSNYAIAGNTIVWSFLPSTEDTRVYMYDTRRNTSQTVSVGEAHHPIVGGNTIAWAERAAEGWIITTADSAGGAPTQLTNTRTATLPRLQAVLDGGGIAYTLSNTQGGTDLYLVASTPTKNGSLHEPQRTQRTQRVYIHGMVCIPLCPLWQVEKQSLVGVLAHK